VFVVGLRMAPACRWRVVATASLLVSRRGAARGARGQMAIRRSGTWCRKITGTPVSAPSRRYAKLVPPTSTVSVGACSYALLTITVPPHRSACGEAPEGRHYSRRARCAQEQEEDRRSWPCPSSTSRSGLCSVHWFGDVVAWTSRTSSCWSCATSSMFCAARSRGRSFAPLTVPCSPRRPATCHAPRAKRVWSPRERCCGGIAHSCTGNGGSRPAGADAHPPRLR
jgi:hypothetical protein